MRFPGEPMPLMMRKSGTSRFAYRFMDAGLFVLLFSLVLASEGYAQEVTPHQGEVVTPLSDLLKEAEQNNPQIRAARQGWEAAKQVPSQGNCGSKVRWRSEMLTLRSSTTNPCVSRSSPESKRHTSSSPICPRR